MKQYQKTFREYDKSGREYGKWFTVAEHGHPPDLEVVIVEFSGWWHGSGGVKDLYWFGDDWFNYPEKVTIERWMWIPD